MNDIKIPAGLSSNTLRKALGDEEFEKILSLYFEKRGVRGAKQWNPEKKHWEIYDAINSSDDQGTFHKKVTDVLVAFEAQTGEKLSSTTAIAYYAKMAFLEKKGLRPS